MINEKDPFDISAARDVSIDELYRAFALWAIEHHEEELVNDIGIYPEHIVKALKAIILALNEHEFNKAYSEHITESYSNYVLAKNISDSWEEKHKNMDATLIQ